ncbi:MAG: hypothetical protein KJ566_01495 [Nanoarchaeota archaeon]|nr:hypothetical protein [Nanoarchaeota archaeon]
MFGFIERDYMGRFCQLEIAKVNGHMQEEFEKHEKVNVTNLKNKIVPFRGHHLLSLKNYILKPQVGPDYENYEKLFYQKKHVFYQNLLQNNLDISLKIVENEPDFICNLGCWQRQPTCFTDFGENAEDYDGKIAMGFGFNINQIYFTNEVIEKVKSSSFKH